MHWEQQREILDDALRRTLGVDPTRCDLIITEPPFALPRTREALDEMVFEYFGFRRALVTTPAKLTKRFADFVDAKKRDAKDCVRRRAIWGWFWIVGFLSRTRRRLWMGPRCRAGSSG